MSFLIIVCFGFPMLHFSTLKLILHSIGLNKSISLPVWSFSSWEEVWASKSSFKLSHYAWWSFTSFWCFLCSFYLCAFVFFTWLLVSPTSCPLLWNFWLVCHQWLQVHRNNWGPLFIWIYFSSKYLTGSWTSLLSGEFSLYDLGFTGITGVKQWALCRD